MELNDSKDITGKWQYAFLALYQTLQTTKMNDKNC